MKKLLITIITINVLLWLGLNNIANADHKQVEHNFNGMSFSAPGSNDYQKLETELVENKLTTYVDKQLKNNDFLLKMSEFGMILRDDISQFHFFF